MVYSKHVVRDANTAVVGAVGAPLVVFVASKQRAWIRAVLPVFLRGGSAVLLRGSADRRVCHDGEPTGNDVRDSNRRNFVRRL